MSDASSANASKVHQNSPKMYAAPEQKANGMEPYTTLVIKIIIYF